MHSKLFLTKAAAAAAAPVIHSDSSAIALEETNVFKYPQHENSREMGFGKKGKLSLGSSTTNLKIK